MNKPKRRFYLLDLDRTLFDTVGAAEAMISIIAEHDSALADKIRSDIEDYARFGQSYSIYDAIVDGLGEDVARAVEVAYVEQGRRQPYLHDGALELMEWLRRYPEKAAGFGILTFGSEIGQRMKIEAARLEDIPAVVTDQKYKGSLIATWKKGDVYVLPEPFAPREVDEVVLIDDRPGSFEGSPDDMIGYWVTAHTTVLDEVPLPVNVQPIRSLRDVIEREEERLATS